jgi:FKBP-type peptidyl-prolyl cis-trans isomerase FkpA
VVSDASEKRSSPERNSFASLTGRIGEPTVWEKFWPLIVLIAVGVVTLALLVPQGGKEKDGPPGEPGEKVAVADGLEYEDLSIGDGEEVKTGDTVKMQYTGKLRSNGLQFDSNVGKAPYPVTLGAGGVIKGWDMGIPGMRVGGRRKLYIPAKLAYAERGFPPDIPPNADLVFEVKVLGKVR